MKSGSIQRSGDQVASVRVPGHPLVGEWRPSNVERALLRFRGAKLHFSESPPVMFSVYINLDTPEDASKEHPGFVGQFKKEPDIREDQIIVFDVTRVLIALAKSGDRVSFTVFLETDRAIFSWKSIELAIVAKEVLG